MVKTEKGSLSRSFALNPPKFNWPEMLSKNVQLLNTSCGGVSTRLNRGSPDRPRNLIAQILTNRAIVIFLTNFGPLVNFFEIFFEYRWFTVEVRKSFQTTKVWTITSVFFLLKLYRKTLLFHTNHLKIKTPSFGQKMYFNHQSLMLPFNYPPKNVLISYDFWNL